MTELGTVLDGKYEILKKVGQGGMSIVYLAMDNRLNKQWAVKEIKNDGSKSVETLLKGLEREANILKNVDHPVLPRIVDIINENGTIYVIMDFVEGKPLNEVLKAEGAQKQSDVIEWGRALASALDYLHSMNPPIIYRDMKPSNVMLKPDGSVKLIDFGTAKEYIIENNADTTALGTRGYAAPEQFGDAQGRGIYNTDARTDIYNLGATLYHLVTGKNPCEPPYEIKPIRQWNPMLSSGLEQIIIKCCQPNPNDRYQSCSELLYALDHYNELDNEYRAKAKKKLVTFGVMAGLSLLSVGCAIFGGVKKNEIKEKNYSNERISWNEAEKQGLFAEDKEKGQAGDTMPASGDYTLISGEISGDRYAITVHNGPGTDGDALREPAFKSVIRLYIENGVMREKLVYESEHDGLTGLLNKGKYLSMAEKNFVGLDSIAIFNFDVNNLKKMNDLFGHEAGDKLIIKSADSIRKVINNKVHGFRMGGDEFLMVAENVTRKETDTIKKRWEEELARLNTADDGINCVIALGVAYGEKAMTTPHF